MAQTEGTLSIISTHRIQVGIEIGGTFTDVILVDEHGTMHIEKVPSTPADLTDGALRGLTRVLDRAGCQPDSVEELLHGSTIATNALIERKGANVGFITTAGFEDMLLIGRQEREDVNNMFYERPKPLVGRHLTRGVLERIAADGTVLTAITEADIERVLGELIEEGDITSLAVCLLHAYRNQRHELAIAELVAKRYPEIDVSLSGQVSPEHREYERASTTVMSAYIGPVVRRYLSSLTERLHATGCTTAPLIMQSNGGVLPSAGTTRQPAGMYLSGPAAGVTGAAYLAKQAAITNLLTMDIGGTSCDLSVISGGEPQMTVQGVGGYRIHGQPLNLVMMDITALGAGGGSIAAVDSGGMLQVGPLSAGADPGPACYDRNGDHFTLTDALLVLGLIEPARFANGEFELKPSASRQAAEPIANSLGMDVLGVARSVHQIAIANVSQGARLASIERGRDPREHALCAFGGVGPLLAADVAEALDIRRVVIPPAPGVFSAVGLCVADMRMDFVRTLTGVPVSNLGDGELKIQADVLTRQARETFAELGIHEDDIELSFSADCRYAGQGYELRIPVIVEAVDKSSVDVLRKAFHQTHARQHGHDFPERVVELVNLRVAALRRRDARPGKSAGLPAYAQRQLRTVEVDGTTQWPVYERSHLEQEARYSGPSLIVEDTSTTVVPPGWSVRVGALGMLDLNREAP